MKNGVRLLWIVFALSLAVVVGIFIGRKTSSVSILLATNSGEEVVVTEEFDPRLDINKATKVQLMELPGIGELTADNILEYRANNGDFQTTDELLNVEGIGEKKLLQIEHYIKVGG